MGNEENAQYYLGIRNDLIRLIPPQARSILEVGCAAGMTGKTLREKGFEEIVGIEVNEEAASIGKSYYDQVIIGDAEKVELPFEKGHFDCILYGDVLEHLINPWQVLKEHKSFLKKGGTIICSIPNIRHYRVIRRLVFRGKWEYADSGILDKTHLRFFTLGSIRKMVKEAGFEIRDLVKRPSAPSWLKLLNRMLGGRLIDFLVRRYIIVAFMKE